MALEAVVFQQDPFSFGCRDVYAMGGGWSYGFGFEEDKVYTQTQTQTLDANVDHQQALHGNWESSCSSMVQHLKEWDANSSSTEACTGDGLLAGVPPPPQEPAATSGRRKRRRTRSVKNKEQVENQRMTHIAVERNRRRQMNEHLAVLRSLMPASYVQRGDQASIIGGAINFVKELEQLLQPLEAQKLMKQRSQTDSSTVFSNFFTFPQYSTYSTHYNSSAATKESMAEKRSAIADVEVTMVETHANIRVLSRTRPKQLFKMVAWLHSVRLTILHLNVTTVDHMVLYSFSAKVEDDCVLSSVNEIATAVYETVGRIQGEAPLT
ncbi:transcription factor bHLH94-like [Vitis riparia]|uniref:transcription factor bHLH94-like n=1 Tax=Vitis riparia TaxID=96939 RepID=UPI00155AE712|nr:transcription factor bHLH94-like [Vitis riparia]